MDQKLWQINLREAPYSFRSVRQILPLPDDQILLLGRENGRGKVAVVDADGELQWSLNADGEGLPYVTNIFDHALVDAEAQVLLIADNEGGGSQRFSFISLAGMPLATLYREDFHFPRGSDVV